MAKYIYFTYGKYGPKRGKQTKWCKKKFSGELPRTSKYLSRIMMVLSFLVIEAIFRLKNGKKTTKLPIFANLGKKTSKFCSPLYLSEFLFVREMLNTCENYLLKVSKKWIFFEVGQLHFPIVVGQNWPKLPFFAYFLLISHRGHMRIVKLANFKIF